MTSIARCRALARVSLGCQATLLCLVPLGGAAMGQAELGHQKCTECHQAEVNAWKASPHFTKSHQLLTTKAEEAQKFASKLGLSGAVTSHTLCASCHGDVRERGNSCESCHGGAGKKGDKQGWFTAHSYFGRGLDPKNRNARNKEVAANYQKRMKYCDAMGMRRSGNVYALAKNCFECHTVPNEKLVQAGHPAGKTGSAGIEFVEWAQGAVRHNFQANQEENALAPTVWLTNRFTEQQRTVDGHRRLMYVAGLLADLEVSLRSRGQATARGNFLDNANKRILAAKGDLEDVDKKVEIAEVKTALDAVKSLKRNTLRKLDGNINFAQIAGNVGKAGNKLATSHDGSAWAAIDRMVPKKGKGKAFP